MWNRLPGEIRTNDNYGTFIRHCINFKIGKNRGTLRSKADLKASMSSSSSFNSGYYPCPLMSPEERNELMGGTEVRLVEGETLVPTKRTSVPPISSLRSSGDMSGQG